MSKKGSIDQGTMSKKGSIDQGKNGHTNLGFENHYQDPLSSVSSDPNRSSTPHGLPDSGEPAREVWDKPIEFLFSCIAMSVGLGNVWRFPATAFQNGGGVFLIPYLVVLTFIGRPIYFLEMALGQFCSYGQIKAWKLAPFFKGVGYGSAIGTACVLSYYCSIMATTIFYLIMSFRTTLPWDDCSKPWGHDNVTGVCYKDISQRYYDQQVYPQVPNLDGGIGTPMWELTLCLVATWAIIFFTLVNGVKSSGKVAYFTALFPYVVLIILLVRGLTLDGAWKGIKYFLKPDWGKLLKPQVWYAAVSQCFFSLSTGFGPIIMFSSYNPFRHNVYRDALIISVTDTLTSLLAGFTIFAVLGFLAESNGVPVADVVAVGPGLAFVSYPAAIASFDVVPQLFAVLFFFMLLTLGVGSASSLAGGLITIICDQWPNLTRWQVTLGVSIAGFSIGLIYVTPGGLYMLTLVDEFGATFVIYVMAMTEVAAIAWVYGINNFAKDIEFMLGLKIGYYWKFCWFLFIPLFLMAILLYQLIENFNPTHNEQSFKGAALVSGWLLTSLALLVLPGFALHSVLTRKSHSFMDKLKESFRPTKDWGPRDPTLRAEWEAFKKTH